MYNQEIDTQFQQLQATMQQTENQLGQIVQQLRSSQNAEIRELEFTLRELALSLQQGRGQVSNLLSALHMQFSQQGQQPGMGQGGYPVQQGYGQSGGYPQGGGFGQQSCGFLQTVERAVEMGAGFGIGDDLVNRIF